LGIPTGEAFFNKVLKDPKGLYTARGSDKDALVLRPFDLMIILSEAPVVSLS
jgi:hypothetical protein